MERQRITDDGETVEPVETFVPRTPHLTVSTPDSGARRGALQVCAEVLRVSAHSRPSAVAGAIAGVFRQDGCAEIQAIGAGATNQAVKAIAIARAYLHEEAVDLCCIPSFIDVDIDREARTALRLLVEQWRP